MGYSEYVDGYKEEDTFGTSTITNSSATTYRWGAINERSDWPSPKTSLLTRATEVNKKELSSIDDIIKKTFSLKGMMGMVPQNGVFLWAALGKSSTVDNGDGTYTHTITPTTDGSQLPSFTHQHEKSGTGSADWATQFTGMKVGSMMLQHDMQPAPLLTAKVDWMAKKAEKKAFTLDSAPSLPSTANTDPYCQLTRTFGGVSLDGLTQLKIQINNNIVPQYAHTYDGSGNYTGRWPYKFLEGQMKQYQVGLEIHPTNIETDMWDDLVATGNTKDAVFKWERSADDYIQVTCSDCAVTEHALSTPEVGETEFDTVVMIPRAISIEVKDKIAGSAYGE